MFLRDNFFCYNVIVSCFNVKIVKLKLYKFHIDVMRIVCVWIIIYIFLTF